MPCEREEAEAEGLDRGGRQGLVQMGSSSRSWREGLAVVRGRDGGLRAAVLVTRANNRHPVAWGLQRFLEVRAKIPCPRSDANVQAHNQPSD